MKQFIQTLHKNNETPKGFMLDLVKNKIDNKTDLTPLEVDLKDLINFEKLDDTGKENLKMRLKKMSLLSNGLVNPKTAKNLGLNVSNWILHLSPSDLSGFNVCPAASKGCRASCLNGAGRGLFDGVQLPRLRKTLYFIKFREQFLMHLDKEVSKIERDALRDGLMPIIRLNGTSDLSFENFKIRDNKSIFELYQNVTFYDYTKVFSRLKRLKLMQLKNYHVTFSASELNHEESRQALSLGFNVAMVFDTIPTQYKGFTVINGDEHDFRFLDKGNGVIVGLKAKGPAKRDSTGFVRQTKQTEIKKVG
jgi:hypothetical protein